MFATKHSNEASTRHFNVIAVEINEFHESEVGFRLTTPTNIIFKLINIPCTVIHFQESGIRNFRKFH